MKIKFKLTRRQLFVWGGFLQATNMCMTSQRVDKIIEILLDNLLYRLRRHSDTLKDKYSFSIPEAEALAFVEHCQRTVRDDIPAVDLIIINHIVGIIDQKTK